MGIMAYKLGFGTALRSTTATDVPTLGLQSAAVMAVLISNSAVALLLPT